MTGSTASDLAHIKRAIGLYLKKGPRTQTGLDAMLRLVEGLCDVIRKQEGIDGTIWRKEDEHENPTDGTRSDCPGTERLH